MGRVILHATMTFDGVVSDVEKWANITDEIIDDAYDYYQKVDALLFGGNTFDGMAGYWTVAEKESASPSEKRFAVRMGEMMKYSVTDRQRIAAWKNSAILDSFSDAALTAGVTRLRQQHPNGVSLETGIRTWQRFLRLGLYNELMIYVQSVIAGDGTKLFSVDGPQIPLTLLSSRTFKNGTVRFHYRRTDRM